MLLKDGQARIEPRLAQRSQAREEIRRMPIAMARHRDANVLVENTARASAPPARQLQRSHTGNASKMPLFAKKKANKGN